MKFEDKFVIELFYTIEKVLFRKSKLLFFISFFILIVSGYLLYTINIYLVSLLITYPIVYLFFLAGFNFYNVNILSAVGIREGKVPYITKPEFDFTDYLGAKQIEIRFDSNKPINESIDAINKTVDLIPSKNKILYYGRISVPINAYIGYKLAQKREVEIYNFNRTKNKWYLINEFSTYDKVSSTFIAKNKSNVLNVILPLSYPIIYDLIVDKECDCLEVNTINSDIDQEIPYQEIVKCITDKIIFYDMVNFYVSANNGFVFYLGRRLSDSNMPTSYFYEYGGGNNKKYLYKVHIQSGNIEFL